MERPAEHIFVTFQFKSFKCLHDNRPPHC